MRGQVNVQAQVHRTQKSMELLKDDSLSTPDCKCLGCGRMMQDLGIGGDLRLGAQTLQTWDI